MIEVVIAVDTREDVVKAIKVVAVFKAIKVVLEPIKVIVVVKANIITI
jgi:hypothetical protein